MKVKNKKYIYQPSLDMMEGLQVDKNTKFTYENDKVKQELKNLELTYEIAEKGDNFKTVSQVIIYLEEGQILQFDEERGYFLPKYKLATIEEAIEDIKTLKDFE